MHIHSLGIVREFLAYILINTLDYFFYQNEPYSISFHSPNTAYHERAAMEQCNDFKMRL